MTDAKSATEPRGSHPRFGLRRVATAAGLAALLMSGLGVAALATSGTAQATPTSTTTIMKYSELPSDHFQCKLTANEPRRVSSSSPIGSASIACTGQADAPKPYPIEVNRITLTVRVRFEGSVASTKAVSVKNVTHLSAQTTAGCNNGTYHTTVTAKVFWGYHIQIPDYSITTLSSPIVRISTCGAT